MIRVRQVKVLVSANSDLLLKEEVSNKLKIKSSDILGLRIFKRSVDARHKPNIYYIYTVDVDVLDEELLLKKNYNNNDIVKAPDLEYKFTPTGEVAIKNKIVVVGSGPCGLMCAYMLALYGYQPLVIERGSKVSKRDVDVNNFWKSGKLNLDSNVQFGEGGAGTYSDGKLNTLVRDKGNRQRLVFETFVASGANEEILYEAKPHIGTDNLKKIVSNIDKKIISLGGEIRFNTKLVDIKINNDKLESIILDNGEEILCDALVLAIGHSARDTFSMLYERGVCMEAKPFAVGVRVQHPQSMINMSRYGVLKHDILKEASYKLVHRASNNRGVYTFCMCPGGYVVNASSEEGRLAINGMSNYKRDSGNANSAVIVTVGPGDFGTNPMAGIKFQEDLERRAYLVGNGRIPVCLYGDYRMRKLSHKFGKIKPVFKGEYNFSKVWDIFPEYVNLAFVEGMNAFSRKIKGFGDDDVIVAGVESRTSSPVRIIRDEHGEANYRGIFPAGEGAGYAGGITSAAMDGVLVFEHIASLYKSCK